MKTVEKTLKERSKTHGDFEEQAKLSQALKSAFTLFSTKPLSNTQKEAVSMILHKLARIGTGNPNFVDSWRDISGYATLVMQELIDEGALDVKQEYIEARQDYKKSSETPEGRKEIEEALRDFFTNEDNDNEIKGKVGKESITTNVRFVWSTPNDELKMEYK